MATMKAKKGNPFEYDTMYNFYSDDYEIVRPDTNIKGIDVIVYDKENEKYFIIECKNRNLSWNELKELYDVNMSSVTRFCAVNNIENYEYLVVYKPKRTEVLVYYCDDKIKRYITTFRNRFGRNFEKRPKGFSVNKLLLKIERRKNDVQKNN